MGSSYPHTTDLTDFTKVIKLKVGQPEHQETFYAFPSMLASHSSFFEAALKDCWEEGFSGEIAMPEDEPQVVHNYLHFAQAGSTPLSFIWFPEEDKRIAQDLLTQQLKLYIFADKVQDLDTKDAVTKCLFQLKSFYEMEYHALFPDEAQVWLVYENTVKGDPVRKFVVDVFAQHGEATGENALGKLCGEDFPPEFLIELVLALVKLKAERTGGGTVVDDEEYMERSIRVTNEEVAEVDAGRVLGSSTFPWWMLWEEWGRILQRVIVMAARLVVQLFKSPF